MVQLDCSGKLGKVFLVVVNLVFILTALALILPGILIQLDVGIITSSLTPLLNQLSFGGMSLGNAVNALSILLICIGCFILVVAAIGMCGACYNSRIYLIVYSIVVIVFWVVEVVVVVLWITMRADVETKVKAQMVSQLNDNYQYDDMTSHSLSTAFNYLFMQMECCAINGVTGTTNDFDTSVWVTSSRSGSQNIPKACCGATVTNYNTFSITSCTDTVASGYYTTGCYDAMYNAIFTYSSIFIAIGLIVIAIETLAIIAACCMCHQIGRFNKAVDSWKDSH